MPVKTGFIPFGHELASLRLRVSQPLKLYANAVSEAKTIQYPFSAQEKNFPAVKKYFSA